MTIEDLRAVLDKRTPGVWHRDDDEIFTDDMGGQDFGVVADCRNTPGDAAAIVAAVNLIGPALDVVEAARAFATFYEMTTEGPNGIGEQPLMDALAAFDAELSHDH